MLPYIHDQNLTRGEGKQGGLPLKVLVFAPLATVGALDVHDEDIVGHVRARGVRGLVVRQPDSFGGLPPIGFLHDAEIRVEEGVEKGGFAGRLGAEDGDQMIVEADGGDVGKLEVFRQVWTVGGESI